jgi:hypothetical protein
MGGRENPMDRRRKPKVAKARAKRPHVRKAPKGAGTKARDLETRLAASLEREQATGALLRTLMR